MITRGQLSHAADSTINAEDGSRGVIFAGPVMLSTVVRTYALPNDEEVSDG